ncbi:hypothetical protein I316_05163 [Kwoniella heveanensis BCC8398]|uniref:Uncharacterized protein n=1 Tax=Kwoniella heveanensis BCC8398 TaxID=1296120 RepID=A0A1B9GQ48_9TREE|nr:hypothetical protein I316_05163 [Kwoniella heveanensis BCC8398]
MSSDVYGMSDVENDLPEKDEEMPIDPILLGIEGSPDSRFQVLVPEPEVERSDQDAHIASTAESSTHAVQFPVNTEQGPSSSSAESTSKMTTHSGHGHIPNEPATAPPKGKRWILVSDDDESEQQLAKKKKKKQRRKKQKDEVDGSDDPSQKKQKGRRQRKKAATEEGKEAAQPPPKPYGRRPLIAKEVKWKDIPDWRDRTDCPLFKLPAEVLDLCFGLGSDLDVGLSCRDYVALAGASRYFRQQLTDDVFHEILHERRVINSPNCTKNCADRIFSTTVDDWSNPPKRQIGPTIEGNHWHPRGTRSEWSEAHYIVYKEEQAVWQYTRKRQMEIVRDERLKRADWKLRKDAESVEVNGQMRRIVAYAKGRSKGQPPPKKDDQGIPEDAGIPPKIPEREPEPYIT